MILLLSLPSARITGVLLHAWLPQEFCVTAVAPATNALGTLTQGDTKNILRHYHCPWGGTRHLRYRPTGPLGNRFPLGGCQAVPTLLCH